MAVQTVCRDCGVTIEASRSDILKGPQHWQRCPVCRDRDGAKPTESRTMESNACAVAPNTEGVSE